MQIRPEGALGSADIEPFDRRGIERAERRHAILDEADIDGEFAALGDEFAGAVERIDQQEGAARGLAAALRHRFLGDHRHAGQQLFEARAQQFLGGEVGGGDRALIGLGAGLEALGADAHHHRAGGKRRLGKADQQRRIARGGGEGGDQCCVGVRCIKGHEWVRPLPALPSWTAGGGGVSQAVCRPHPLRDSRRCSLPMFSTEIR